MLCCAVLWQCLILQCNQEEARARAGTQARGTQVRAGTQSKQAQAGAGTRSFSLFGKQTQAAADPKRKQEEARAAAAEAARKKQVRHVTLE
jgi:hypothetical protein